MLENGRYDVLHDMSEVSLGQALLEVLAEPIPIQRTLTTEPSRGTSIIS